MSVSKDRLYKLIEDLNDQEAEKLINITEALIVKRKAETVKDIEPSQTKKFDPEEFRGKIKHPDIDVEKECKELRDQWKRNIC